MKIITISYWIFSGAKNATIDDSTLMHKIPLNNFADIPFQKSASIFSNRFPIQVEGELPKIGIVKDTT